MSDAIARLEKELLERIKAASEIANRIGRCVVCFDKDELAALLRREEELERLKTSPICEKHKRKMEILELCPECEIEEEDTHNA